MNPKVNGPRDSGLGLHYPRYKFQSRQARRNLYLVKEKLGPRLKIVIRLKTKFLENLEKNGSKKKIKKFLKFLIRGKSLDVTEMKNH